MTDHLLTACQAFAPLPAAAMADLSALSVEKHYKRGEMITHPGTVCRNVYFVEKGLVKLYSMRVDRQFIMRFFTEGSFVTIIDSFWSQQPSKYQLIALEPTTVQQLSREAVAGLCKKHHSLEHLFSQLATIAAANMMERMNEILEEDAATRYSIFLAREAALFQRIKLGDLAAYLGVTQTTLSRIRAQQRS